MSKIFIEDGVELVDVVLSVIEVLVIALS